MELMMLVMYNSFQLLIACCIWKQDKNMSRVDKEQFT